MSITLESVKKWYDIEYLGNSYKVVVNRYSMEYEPNIRLYGEDMDRIDTISSLGMEVLSYFYDNLESE